MAYITTGGLQQRLGDDLYARLTDRDAGNTVDLTTAQQIVDEAEGIANSYFSLRYETPVSVGAHPELDGLLEARVLDIAETIAWRASPFVSDTPDRVRSMYEDALSWFRAVGDGGVNLPSASPLPGRVTEDDGPRFTTSTREFTQDEFTD